MRFDITDDQKSIRDLLESFLGDRLGDAQGVGAIASTELDRTLWQDISALGLGGVLTPEDRGGLGLDLLTLAVIAERLGYYAAPAPVAANVLAAWIIAKAGTADQRARWLEPLIAGEAIAAFALQEAQGWRPEHWTPSGAIASGRKLSVERAAEADVFVVGLAGGALGLAPAGQGLTVEPIDTLDRTRPLGEVVFDGAEIELLSSDSALAERLLDALAVVHAADALGAASAIQTRAVGYAHERKQFGQLIGSFQALKHQLADMSVALEPARPLVWYAAHGWDTDREDAPRMAALAKAHLGDVAVGVSRAAIEAHGGIGYTWEHPAHLFLKRAMHDRAILGGPAEHRARAATLAGW